jgi:hypothetical protein
MHEDEEKLKGLTPKERDEWRKVGTRLSGKRFPLSAASLNRQSFSILGRQLFERGDKNLEDETLLEEDSVSVDISQFERIRIEEEDEVVEFSDSD